MTSMTTKRRQDNLQDNLEELRKAIPPEVGAELVEAMNGIVTALEYRDWTLVHSGICAVGHVYARIAEGRIEVHEQILLQLRKACDELLSREGPPDSESDATGKKFEEIFGKWLEGLTQLESQIVRFAINCGAEVPNAEKLTRIVNEVRRLKETVLDGWPWTSLGLPPVDRRMIAESRNTIARGGGEAIEDVIARFSENSPSN